MRVLQIAKRSVVTVALVSLTLTGCSGDPVSDAPFNPGGTTADVEAMNSTFTTETFNSFSTFSWMFDAALGGSPIISNSVAAMNLRAKSPAEVRAAAVRVAQKFAASTRKADGLSASVAASSIPAGVAGRTFVYDPGTATYVLSDRPLLATSKVRFILYAVDPVSFAPVIPLVETGYVELTDLSSGSTQAARIQVVSGSTTYIEYTVTGSSGVSSATITVKGYVTDGTTRANITLRSAFSFSTGLTLTYALGVPDRDVSVNLTISIPELTTTSPTSINLTMRGPNGTVGIRGQFTGTDGTFTILINGDGFATITTSGASITITRTDGTPLTDEEHQAVNGVFELQTGALDAFAQMMAPVGALFSEQQ
jgi:hypothetical protein